MSNMCVNKNKDLDELRIQIFCEKHICFTWKIMTGKP